ncbi:hypothetical protein CRM22_003190 [Opisthorchis felineus]|nr:hypothetical protein CRM22_003190 [Opisthorchis felineus]
MRIVSTLLGILLASFLALKVDAATTEEMLEDLLSLAYWIAVELSALLVFTIILATISVVAACCPNLFTR